MDKYEVIKFKDNEFEMDVNVSPNEDTVWLSLNEICLLFDRDRSVIGKHIKRIYIDGELDKNRTWANFARHLPDGRIYLVDHYNLAFVSVLTSLLLQSLNPKTKIELHFEPSKDDKQYLRIYKKTRRK